MFDKTLQICGNIPDFSAFEFEKRFNGIKIYNKYLYITYLGLYIENKQ